MTLKEILRGKVAVKCANSEKEEFKSLCEKQGYEVAEIKSKRLVFDCWAHTDCGGFIANYPEHNFVTCGYKIMTFEQLKNLLEETK